MAELRLSGLATGIDTGQIIEQLMEVNRRRLQMMEIDLTRHKEKRGAVSGLESKLSAFKTSVDTLSDSSQLRSYKAVTSDEDFISASANSNAIEGNHSVQVKQLATSDRWIHDGFKYETSLVGAGTFIFSYDFKELSITTVATTTLEDMVGLINNDSDNPGVNASILKYDDGNDGVYHLVMSGQESGSDYQVQINASNTEVYTAEDELLDGDGENATETTLLTDLSISNGTLGDGSTSDRIRVTGNQHDGTAIDYYFDVTQYTTVADVLEEIEDAFGETAKATLEKGKIVVTDATYGVSSMTVGLSFVAGAGSSATLTLPTFTETTEGGLISADLAGFTESDFIEVQSAQDSKIRVDGYPLDSTAVAEVQLLTSDANATSGTYTLSFGGDEAVLNYSDDITTVQAALNGLASITALGGVTVGGTPPSDSGSQMSITFGTDAGNVDDVTISSSLSPGNHSMSTLTEGKDAWISRSANTIDDVISGVTLHLHDTTEDGSGGYDNIEVNLTRDTEALKEKLDGMVQAYNTAVMFIQEKTAYDPEEKKSGVLGHDYSVQTIWSEIKDPFIGLLAGFGEDDTFTSPADIGLTLGADGMLELDSAEFDEAIVDDYLGVLSIIGAMKSGSSDSIDIKFYGAGKDTEAGEYEVKVTGDGSVITSAQIRQVGEATWRDATFSGNIVTGDTSEDSNNNPMYPEYNLQISVNLSETVPGGTTVNVLVKEGFAGAAEGILEALLNSTKGRVPISLDSIDEQIKNTNDRIYREERRLVAVEKRLIGKFSRLERTLALIQQQMGALSMI